MDLKTYLKPLAFASRISLKWLVRRRAMLVALHLENAFLVPRLH